MSVVDANNIQPQQIEEESTNKVEEILDENMEHLMNSLFIPEMKRAAAAANLPPSFAKGIKFVKNDNLEGKVVNVWGSTEKPLALWFNYGTRDHGALGNWALHWVDKVTGKDIYAMYVRGVPRTLAMEIGFELGMKRLKREVPRFVEAHLR